MNLSEPSKQTMDELVRVAVFSSGDDCIYRDNQFVKGICWDLWVETAKDLNVSFKEQEYPEYPFLFHAVKNGSADVIVQRVSQTTMNHFGLDG